MKDYIVGISGLGLSIYVFFASKAFERIGSGLSEDPAYYPRILSVLLAAISIGLLMEALRKHKKIEGHFNKELLINLGKFFGLLIMYIVLINPIGFVIATALFAFSMIWYLGGTKKQIIIYPLPISLLTYLLFSYLLRIALPKGILYFI